MYSLLKNTKINLPENIDSNNYDEKISEILENTLINKNERIFLSFL
jgi:hypothetical protein